MRLHCADLLSPFCILLVPFQIWIRVCDDLLTYQKSDLVRQPEDVPVEGFVYHGKTGALREVTAHK